MAKFALTTSVVGLIGITVVNAVRTGVSTAGWSTGTIGLTALFGLMLAAGVVIALVAAFAK